MIRMIIRIGASAALLVLLTACGSGSGDSTSADSAPEVLPTPTSAAAVYVGAGDGDQVNAAGDKVWAAAGKAADVKEHKKCNKASTAAWAPCWHALLDPVKTSLGGLADELKTLQDKKYAAAGCEGAFADARTTFTGFETKVTTLLDGIDSDERPAQEKAMEDYMDELTAIADGYTAPFQAITAACYSPEDLVRINASASPRPTAS